MFQLDVVTQPEPQLRLLRGDGTMVLLHPLWLRERCRDPATNDPLTGQRLYNPASLDAGLAIAAVLEAGPERVVLRFNDGHVSRFAPRALLAEAAATPAHDGLPAPCPWTGALSPLPRHRWEGGAGLLPAVTDFLRLGFVILSGVPRQEGTILEVARAFGFPRQTNFGTLFDVRSVLRANDLAYTGYGLDPHVDNPYRDPVPGIQLLHCLVNETPDGLSTLVDGLAVAEALRSRDPDAFRLLAGIPVRFRFADAATEHVRWAPLIELGPGGAIAAINYSPRLDCTPLLPAGELDAFYRARRRFDRMLGDPANELRFRLEDGELIMFDNRRTLHGRTAFDPSQGRRHLQGCYIDMDGPRSLYRVLTR